MLYIALCDDFVICEEVSLMLKEYASANGVAMKVTPFYNGEDLYEVLLAGEHFDLIFLDTDLGRLNGVALGHLIREDLGDCRTAIVYISDREERAIELFSVQPMDFLVKPISAGQIWACMDLLRKLRPRNNAVFFYKKNFGTRSLSLEDIYYFASDARKVEVVHKNGRDSFYEKLDAIQERLEGADFLRIHKSFLVNYNYIIHSELTSVKLGNGETLPISRVRQKEVLQRLSELQRTGRC